LNLSVDETVQYDKDDLLAKPWRRVEGSTRSSGQRGAKKKENALSNIGHGQVPFRTSEAALAGVSFAAINQRATVSFASLRRVATGDRDADAAGRALLVSLGLLAHVTAFGRAFSLRSGCDLRPVRTRWTWLGADGDEEIAVLDHESAVELFR